MIVNDYLIHNNRQRSAVQHPYLVEVTISPPIRPKAIHIGLSRAQDPLRYPLLHSNFHKIGTQLAQISMCVGGIQM